jgi:acyl-coenzyme A thioesterase 13
MSAQVSDGRSPELEHVKQIFARQVPNSAIYNFLLSDAEITYAVKGVVKARVKLSKNHVNSRGGLHGAVSATIVDWIGGMAIGSWDLRDKTGVSTDIHVTYLSSAKEGEWIEAEGKANKVGNSLAFTTATIYKLDEQGQPGAVIATGSHSKYVKI